MTKAIVLICFAAVLSSAVLVATERARSMGIDDTTPPVGWVSLPASVPSVHVDVVVVVADRDTGVIELRLSNDGATWSGWEGFPSPSPDGAIHVPWELSPGTGARTVTVQVRNGSGLVATFVARTALRPSKAFGSGAAAVSAARLS